MDLMCAARMELQPNVVRSLRYLPGDLPPAEEGEVDASLLCLLEAHDSDQPHYSLARTTHAAYRKEVWVCWHDGQQPSGVMALPDCPAVLGDESCVLFRDHPGAHSWKFHDTDFNEALRRLE